MTVEEYIDMVKDAGPATKEMALREAAELPYIRCYDFNRILRAAYPDLGMEGA